MIIVKINTLFCIDVITGHACFKEISDLAGAIGLYKTEKGYIVHGELSIVMFDRSLEKIWSFVGSDIFVTISDKEPFRLLEDRIELYDFEDNYYLIDLHGKRIN